MRTFWIGLFAALISTSAFAHGGGLDSAGCHHDHVHGGYHCHRSDSILQEYLRRTTPDPNQSAAAAAQAGAAIAELRRAQKEREALAQDKLVGNLIAHGYLSSARKVAYQNADFTLGAQIDVMIAQQDQWLESLLSREVLVLLDNWRKRQSGQPARAEALSRLIYKAAREQASVQKPH